jgi:hypothetical protein
MKAIILGLLIVIGINFLLSIPAVFLKKKK